MSGRGKHQKVLRTDAARWWDKVCADIASAADCAAMSEHRISAQLVNDVVNAVVGYGKPKGHGNTGRARPPLFDTGCRIRTGRRPVTEKKRPCTPH